jgi:hypothetical protein
MAYYKYYCSILTLFIGFGFTWNYKVREDKKYLPFGDCVEKGKVNAVFTSTGGHQGNCIAVNLKNLSKDTVFFFMEPGRRLFASDTSMQDILIVKRQEVALLPAEQRTISAYGFCCESNNGSPLKGLSYSIGQMAPADWIKLSKHLSEHNYTASTTQSAVWVLSNNHAVSSVCAEDEKTIMPLRKLLAEIKGVEVPWYSTTYIKDPARVFSNVPEYIYGDLDYTLKHNAIVSIVVRDKWGAIAKMLVEEAAKGPGVQKYELDLNVKGWGKGEYVITIMEDYSNINTSRKFIIE